MITALQAIRRKRAIISYDAAGTATEAEVTEALEIAKDLRGQLQQWLKSNFPQFLNT
ncbi:MAG: hypothetical protein AAB305_00170 [Candidatus Zixiibacteriota bacterium]